MTPDIDFKELTNNELQAFCEENNIDVDSKNVSKPTKTEFLAAIERNAEREKVVTDDFLDVDIADPEAEKETIIADKAPTESRAKKRRRLYNEMHALKRVVVTSNSTSQTKQGLVFITWGNRLLGHNTDRVQLEKPWHVREGALRNMKAAMITESVQDEDGNSIKTKPKKAYYIEELEPLTKEEIQDIARRQQIRDSSIDSLI